MKHWRHGAQRQEYNLPVYKLQHHPWYSLETTNAYNVDARKLILAILAYMDECGFRRAVPFQCTDSEHDSDSILFFRDINDEYRPKKRFCAISLEGAHKLRLICIHLMV